NVFKIHGLYGTNLTGLSIYGTVTQAVPEPLTGVLMVIGVFFFRRRRKTMNAQKPRGREGILSAPIASIFVLATLLLSAPLAKAVITDVEISANFASIIDVIVIPSQPLDVDFITLDISGSASSGNSHIVSSLFQQEENQLTLDLTIDMGISPVISYWSHSEQIGPLVPDTYSATVRLFYPYALPGGELQDTYVTEFTVTPEPGTLLLFGLGGLLLRSSYNNLNISKGESYET
ncbi:MAG: PEP-CTERM sorting domain-containing protein, partial [Phycisphaerae bacterium]|nr:PEP-CTERM sorting domain-containing protein [Phycisphaerae bacterium]